MATQMILHAPMLYPVGLPELEDGAIYINNSHIEELGKADYILRKYSDKPVVEIKDSILMPGFVNAHCHNELTSLKPSFESPNTFTEWLYNAAKARDKMTSDQISESIQTSINSSLEKGITTIGDNTCSPIVINELDNSVIRKVVFIEVRGLDPDKTNELEKFVYDILVQKYDDKLLSFGVAPHSIFSVSNKLMQAMIKLAKYSRLPLSLHALESKDELEYIEEGTGAIPELIEKFGHNLNNIEKPSVPLLDYLIASEYAAKNTMLIHCNYFYPEEAIVLAKLGTHIVVCPGSAEYFNHQFPPFEMLHKYNASICLGTDSILSNDSFNIANEMRRLQSRFDFLEPIDLIKMATINGANALGISYKTGTLEIEKEADIIAVPYNDKNKTVAENIIISGDKPLCTLVSGTPVYDPHNYFGNVYEEK